MQNKQLSMNIKKLCKINKISQKQMLEDLSINRSFFYGMESKDWTPTIDKIVRIADYLGCSIDYLLGRENLVIEQLQSELAQKNRVIEQIKDLIFNETNKTNKDRW